MERVIERFLDYVQIDSESMKEGNFRDKLKSELDKLEIEYIEDNVGEIIGGDSGNLIIKLKGTGDKTILFSAHMDTVEPGIGIKPEIRDGKIYSDGTTILGGDDKIGVAAIMEMLTVLKEENIPHHSVEVVFTVAEESGLFGSNNLDFSQFKADFGVVLDSEERPGFVSLGAPAHNNITAIFKGKASHAGIAPEKGISAIEMAAEAISNMKLGRIDEETTANIGYIKGGGPTNIITDTVEIAGEARSLKNDKLNAQTEHMVECIKNAQEKYGATGEIKVTETYKAFEISEDSVPAKLFKKACENLGLSYSKGKSGGGSDTNHFNENDIPSIDIGVGMENVHSLEEYVAVEDIINTTKILLEIVKA